jgi:hypothetical protein
MYKSATKCNETLGKWCKNKHGASKIIDTFETYHILLWFSPLMLYLGWLVACLYHVWLQTSRLKPLWLFGFWLVIPLYALVNNVLSLYMIMAVIALLVGRSQSFASLHLYWEGILLVHPTPKNQSFPICPPYLPISNLLFQVHLSCFYLSSKLNFLLCEN